MSNDRMFMMAGADADQLEKAFDPESELAKLGVSIPEPLELTEEVLEKENDGLGVFRTSSIMSGPDGEPDHKVLDGVLLVNQGNTLDPYAKERSEYLSGDTSKAMRFNEGKLRYDLLPPEGIEELTAIYTMGANKYAPRNWEKGLSVMGCFASLMRHAFAWARGETLDPESGRHHMGHVMWNAAAIVVFWRRGQEDDRPVILDAE